MHFRADWTFEEWTTVNFLIFAARKISPAKQREIFDGYHRDGLPEEPHREFDDDEDLALWEDGLPPIYDDF